MKKLSNIVLALALVLTLACPAWAHVVGDINADAEVQPAQETAADQKQAETKPKENAQEKPAAETPKSEEKPAEPKEAEQDKPATETAQEQPTEEAPDQHVTETPQPVDSINPAALLPDGTANVVDYAVSESGKEFYIIQTANGNPFYLVLDKDRESNNVYLLSPVDEGDLSDFVKQRETLEPSQEPSPVQPEPDQPTTPDNPMPSSVSYGSWASLAVIVVVGVGAWYYRNKVKPKREQAKQQKKLDEMEFEDDTPPVNEDHQKPQMYVEDEVDDVLLRRADRQRAELHQRTCGRYGQSGQAGCGLPRKSHGEAGGAQAEGAQAAPAV